MGIINPGLRFTIFFNIVCMSICIIIGCFTSSISMFLYSEFFGILAFILALADYPNHVRLAELTRKETAEIMKRMSKRNGEV